MTKEYQVHLNYGAWVAVTIQADSPEEAAEIAFDTDEAQETLCHQCSGTIDLGEPSSCIISQGSEDVYNDTTEWLLRKEIKELKEQLKELEEKI